MPVEVEPTLRLALGLQQLLPSQLARPPARARPFAPSMRAHRRARRCAARAPPARGAAASRWMREPAATHEVVLSVLPTAPVADEYPLPSLDPPHPRLERVLAVVAPWW